MDVIVNSVKAGVSFGQMTFVKVIFSKYDLKFG